MLCHAQSLQFEFRATCGRLSSRAHHQSFQNNRRVSIIILYIQYAYVYLKVLLYRCKTAAAQNSKCASFDGKP